jgi:1,4-alpha-glucan branching enzyme
MKLHYFLSAFLLFSLFSCGDDPIVPPTPTGPQQYGVPLASVPNVDQATIYEVNLRAQSSEGNLQGVISKLQHIKDLGTNVIWLMPIYEQGVTNSVNSPYCIKDYTKVSPEYGTLADLRALTDQAHALGMAVIMDWVANHTSWDHPWISEHPEWYSQNANGQIIIPPGTNWNDVADLNFDQAAMRKAQIDAMKYWVLEANVDGYRCDYADGVPFDFWTDAISQLRALPNRDLLMLAEGTRSDHYQAGFDLTYGWNYYTALKNVWNGAATSILTTTHQLEYGNIPAGKGKVRFTTNHDESAWDASPMSLFNGKNGAIAASVVNIFSGAVPLLYTGQEVGKTGTTPFFTNSTINWTANQDMLVAYQKIYNIYNAHAAARSQAISAYQLSNDLICWKKTSGTSSVLILVNVRNSTINVTLPPILAGNFINLMTNQNETVGTNFALTPYSYRIYQMN